ncbi:MAG: GAF domain-containing protein [Armatimonadota bacterium]|nr:GAF domain-containing protein [Armatimonadota bacterium]
MKRRVGELAVPAGHVYTWAVVLAGAVALAVSLLSASWPGAPRIVLLCFAAVLANALFLPEPSDSDQTLAAAVASAGLTLFGGPATAAAMGVGVLVGQVLIRRRALGSGLFNAGQSVLATLAAGATGFLVHLDMPSWSHAVFVRSVDSGYIAGVMASVFGFVVVTGALTSWRLTLDRQASFVGVFSGSLAFSVANTVVLFALGTISALVILRAVPAEALLLLLPVVTAGVAVLIYAGSRQAATELEVVRGAAADLARCVSAEEIAQVLAASIDRVLSADVQIVFLRAPGQAEMRVAHYRGPGGMGLARQLEPEGLASHALHTGRPMRIGDYERDPRRSPRAEIVFGRGVVRSGLIVPITTGRDTWGLVALARGVRHAFGPRHERVVASLADQVAQALRALHLQDQVRRHADRLAVLQHAGLLTGSTLDPHEACRQLAERAAEMLGTKYALLALVDHGTRELYGEAAYGGDGSSFATLRVRLDADTPVLRELRHAVRERRPIVYDETQIKASGCPALTALPDARSALAVPLLRQGRAIGALMVVSNEPAPFAEAEITTLESAAAQGAAVLEHARQHVAMEAQFRRTEAMLTVFRRLAAASDLHGVFVVLVDGARAVLGADRCLLLVWNGRGPVAQVFASGFSDAFADAIRQHASQIVGRHVAASAHPVAIADFDGDPRVSAVRNEARQEGLRSGIFVPLRAQGELVGALLLAGGHEHAPDVLPLVEMLGEQATASLRHAAALAESEARLAEVALLNRIIGTVGASLELAEVYRTAAAELSSALGIPRVSIYRVDGQILRLAAQVGAPDVPAELPAVGGITGRVVRTGRPEFVASVRDDPDYVSSSFDVTSVAVVPVLREGTSTGLIVAEGVTGRPVTQRTVEFLAAVAQQLSNAVQNAVFYGEQRRAHDELQVLYEAARAVSGTLDLRTVLDSMVSVTCRAFGYDNGAIMMVDAESGDLVVEAGYGLKGTVVGRRLPAGAGISGAVARSGTPALVDAVRADTRDHRLGDRTQSELAVPLIAEGKVLGVFNVESARLAAFGARDLRLLTTLASYAVVAIQNARLYETAQRLAITDGLTELFNHRYLHESLGRVLERARRDDQPVGLIMLEIDHFKRYNDTYGHQSGDEALRTVAGLLRRGSRPSDIVARYGGDEFMVILPGVSKAATHETAERLRRTVEAYPLILGNEVITTVTLSVGVASFPHDGATVDALVEAVDRAQYLAKRSGGNTVHVAQSP